MKKLTATLLSLVMCFSLMAIPAHAISLPDPGAPGTIGVGKTPIDLDDDGTDKPENPIQPHWADLPDPRDDIPVD